MRCYAGEYRSEQLGWRKQECFNFRMSGKREKETTSISTSTTYLFTYTYVFVFKIQLLFHIKDFETKEITLRNIYGHINNNCNIAQFG